MSQRASRTFTVTEGNTALRLQHDDPELLLPDPKTKKARTPLSLVVSTPRRSRSSVVVIFFLVILAATAVVLGTSISVSKGQYELVGLKNQQSDLHKANQTLEQEIAARQAPQNLVSRAAALGMVPAGTTGQIDVRNKTVSGSPLPATADTKGLASIPPALIDPPTAVAPAEPVLSPAAIAQSGEKSQQPAPTTPAPNPAAAVSPELNGGTIPAPAQKDS
ncbi:hypothetical protein [Arthrobacter glacialis]|uniref:Cell division protein FtsL n=1 Tax=Arthrobacter glacialis TaxID=1664 RepID=A0A2S3ZVE9_ARTGL|nr:hypothetical protein [Arthrobacter glacialis]POH58216.1 hypothetical protein CVS28_12270 [Arthrobacter glacialis]POH72847.1 hypothetical protein CVS27_13305 [Arthrobacter glacialis]